jgi:hypothetical protein
MHGPTISVGKARLFIMNRRLFGALTLEWDALDEATS